MIYTYRFSVVFSFFLLCVSMTGYAGTVCSGGTIEDGVQTCTATIDLNCDNKYCGEYAMFMTNATHGTFACSRYVGDCPSCFAADTLVHRNGILTPMHHLKVGDIIEDGPESTSRVIGFLHRDHQVEAEMLQFYSSEDTYLLTISPKHLLSNPQGQFVFAERFAPGMFIKSAQGISVMIGKIEPVKIRGVYAPLTESGTLLVGSGQFVASCYANVENHDLAHTWARWTGAGSDGEQVEPRSIDQAILALAQLLGGAQ